MKNYLKAIFIILGVFIFVIFTYYIVYYFIPQFDEGCLDKLGNDYCNENNYTNYINRIGYVDEDFVCHNGESERINKYIDYSEFYFLKEEYDLCTIKPKNTFKKYALYGGNK